MSRTSARRLIGLLLAVAIGGLTFAAPAGAAAPTVAAASAPITSGVPRFEPAPCAFKFAKDQQEGKTVTCGYAIVPERHANPGGKTIKLPVAVYKALSPTPAAEPIIFLQGGPSETSQILAEFLTGAYYQGLAANNDVIIFDQRGAGFAQPALDCPELSAGSGESRQALVRALAEPSFVDLLLQCRDQFRLVLVRDGSFAADVLSRRGDNATQIGTPALRVQCGFFDRGGAAAKFQPTAQTRRQERD